MALEYQKENGDREQLYWKGQNGHQYTPHLLPWQIHANRFYDLVLNGSSTDDFWCDILKE